MNVPSSISIVPLLFSFLLFNPHSRNTRLAENGTRSTNDTRAFTRILMSSLYPSPSYPIEKCFRNSDRVYKYASICLSMCVSGKETPRAETIASRVSSNAISMQFHEMELAKDSSGNIGVSAAVPTPYSSPYHTLFATAFNLYTHPSSSSNQQKKRYNKPHSRQAKQYIRGAMPIFLNMYNSHINYKNSSFVTGFFFLLQYYHPQRAIFIEVSYKLASTMSQ